MKKSLVIEKIPETNAIFENVNDVMEAVVEANDESIAVISIDDKATKKIGKLSDNGKTWSNEKALDHDIIFEYSMKPFGILDILTNETFVTCTPYCSTSEFKVNCIREYITQKNKKNKIKKLVIFLDNGPENSGKRKLWLKKLVDLSIEYKIVIELVYYPPYHSKYNKIERFWARLQMYWNDIVMDSIEKLDKSLNTVTWKGIKCRGNICFEEYKKGKEVSNEEMKTADLHIIREDGLEKWSIVITPFSN